MRAAAAPRRDRTRHREHLAPLFERAPRGNQRPALFAGFHDDGAEAEPADDPIPMRKVVGERLAAQREFGHHRAVFRHALRQRSMLARIDDVKPRPQYGDRAPAGLQRGLVGLCIDAARQAAHHAQAAAGQIAGQAARHVAPVAAGRPGADDGDRQPVFRGEVAVDVQERRRVVDLGEALGIFRVGPDDEPRPQFGQRVELAIDRGPVGEAGDLLGHALRHARGAEVSHGRAQRLARRGKMRQQLPIDDVADTGHAAQREPRRPVGAFDVSLFRHPDSCVVRGGRGTRKRRGAALARPSTPL